MNNVIIGNLNINSLSSKFDDMKMLMTGMFDALVITKTKLDNTFPVSQFHIDGFSVPYRLSRNRNGGGVIFMSQETSLTNFCQNIVSRMALKDYLLK